MDWREKMDARDAEWRASRARTLAAIESAGAEWLGGWGATHQGRLPDGDVITVRDGEIIRRESAARDKARLLQDAAIWTAATKRL